MWQRFTERARRVVFFAQEEAARLGENYVGTEHFLLGLVRESDSVAARILDRLGVLPEDVRADIQRQVKRGKGSLGQDIQLTPRAKRVIDLAYEEARQLNNNYIGTEHLLLGLIREGDGLAARVLVKLGADLEATRREVYAMQEGEASAPRTGSYEVRTEVRSAARRWTEASLKGGLADTPGSGVSTPAEFLSWLADRTGAISDAHLAAEAGGIATELTRAICRGVTDLRSVIDLSLDQASALLLLARILKGTLAVDRLAHLALLEGKSLAMIFEKPSLRTRVSFETGMFQLGGHALYLQPSDISMGKRESVADVARVMDRMVDGIMARVFEHRTILELAEHAARPVINGLCDREHPCQALSDLMTVLEKRGAVKGQRIAYVGDGNNVAHSLLMLGAKLGAEVVVATPEGYGPDPRIVAAAQADSAANGGSVIVTRDPREACAGADVVYTDVWTSMGQEDEATERARIFAPYQVNEELVALAKPDYIFMHCLPAHRGEEVTAPVMDGSHSVAFDQAENRLHAQKAVLAVLLGF